MELSFEQVGQGIGCTTRCSGKVRGFRQDSRLVEEGDLFFALGGERVDGHAYLKEVASRGAVAAVVRRDYEGSDCGLQLFRVENVLQALQRLAECVHLWHPCQVIGVTGSVGKTTTKEFIATLLEGSFKVGKTEGNANSQVGLPLSVLNARGDEEVFVAEMGMSQPNELEQLVKVIPPDIAVITQIALCHVAHFEQGIEGIASAKAEIFSHPRTRYGVLHRQVASFAATRRGGCEKKIYGKGAEDWTWESCGEQIVIRERGAATVPFDVPFKATHLCENFLAATIVARLMGLSWEQIIARAQLTKLPGKRFECVYRDGITFVNDSYNANPTSMIAALTNLPEVAKGGRRIAVLGAMKELGAYEESGHRDVALCAVECVDDLLCLGRECQTMLPVFSCRGKSAELFEDLELLKQRLFALVKKGDVVLLKGSNSNRLWRLLE